MHNLKIWNKISIEAESQSVNEAFKSVFEVIKCQEQRHNTNFNIIKKQTDVKNTQPTDKTETDPFISKILQIYEKFKSQLK